MTIVMWAAPGGTGLAIDPHLFVATSDGVTGSSDAIDLDSPWSVSTNVEPLAPDATLRVFFDRIYVVSRSSATVQVIGNKRYTRIFEPVIQVTEEAAQCLSYNSPASTDMFNRFCGGGSGQVANSVIAQGGL